MAVLGARAMLRVVLFRLEAVCSWCVAKVRHLYKAYVEER